MGHVYTDLTLTNMFSKQSVNVRALVDTGTTYMLVPPSVAAELGFDIEEVVMSCVTIADGRRVRCPRIAPIEIRFQDRVCNVDIAVLGDQCLMGVIPLEAMDLVVDPINERVTPNAKHPEGPTFYALGARNIVSFDERFSRPQPLLPSQSCPKSA